MKHTFRKTALAALLALAAAGALASGTHAGGHGHDVDEAIGKPGVAGKSVRTINVDMTDNMRFTPSDISVKQGETVRFVVRNVGVLKHELVLGTGKDLRAHYEAMMKNPEMEHADPNMVTLAPGKTGEVLWQFTQAGEFQFACLIPGHFEAGMVGKVTVGADDAAA
eukprot:gene36022-59054_t